MESTAHEDRKGRFENEIADLVDKMFATSEKVRRLANPDRYGYAEADIEAIKEAFERSAQSAVQALRDGLRARQTFEIESAKGSEEEAPIRKFEAQAQSAVTRMERLAAQFRRKTGADKYDYDEGDIETIERALDAEIEETANALRRPLERKQGFNLRRAAQAREARGEGVEAGEPVQDQAGEADSQAQG